MVTALGTIVNLNMLVQLVTHYFMVGTIVHTCCTSSLSQTGSRMVSNHQVIRPFVAGDIQEGASTLEVTDSTEGKALQNKVLQLNTFAKTPVNVDALKNELAFYHSDEAEVIKSILPYSRNTEY